MVVTNCELGKRVWKALTERGGENPDGGPLGIGSPVEYETLRIESGLPAFGNEHGKKKVIWHQGHTCNRCWIWTRAAIASVACPRMCEGRHGSSTVSSLTMNPMYTRVWQCHSNNESDIFTQLTDKASNMLFRVNAAVLPRE